MLAKNEKLVEHISKLIMHVEDSYSSTHNNYQILSMFEKLSMNIKTNGLASQRSNKAYQPPKDKISAPKHIHENGAQSFAEDNETILNQVGLGLSSKEAVMVNDAINEHRKIENTDFQFFGKVLGSSVDYYVIWGYKDGAVKGQDGLNKHVEKEGEGVNAFIVYVTTAKMSNEWIQLPVVEPKQMRMSRKVKLVFKGHLNRDVNIQGFNGTEAHLLKCQLVRILSATKLVPKGIYTINEETGKVEVDLEAVKELRLSKDDAISLDNWVYHYPFILKSGRVTNFIPGHRNEEEADELKEKLEDKDKGIERFSSAFVEDQKIWNSSSFGKSDETVSINKGGDGIQTSYTYIILKHLDWKGVNIVYSVEQQRAVFFYVGLGLKRSQRLLPIVVDKIEDQPKQRAEVDEPNHYEEPKDDKDNDGDDNDNPDGDDRNDQDADDDN